VKTIPSGLQSQPTEGGIQPGSEMIEHWGGRGLLHLKSVIRNLKSVLGLLPSTSCILFFFLFLLFLPLALSFGPWASVADASKVTLGWDSNPEPDLEGYVVYRNAGSPGPPYDYSNTLPEDDLADPLHPKVTLTGLNPNKEYYIALTAYNSEGVESSFSNDVCVEVVGGSVGVCANSSNSGSSNSNNSSNSGGGGWDVSGCFISTAGYDSSTFSKFVAKPVIRSQGLTLLFLLLVLIAAVKFVFNKLPFSITVCPIIFFFQYPDTPFCGE
jgi:hypothetical protein